MASAEEPPDWTDVVATQGRYLKLSIDTPTVFSRYNADFVNTLTYALRTLEDRISARGELYGDRAKEWRFGHTPPLVRDALSEQDKKNRDWIDDLEAPTPSAASATPFVSISQPKYGPTTYVTIPESHGARVAPVDCPEPAGCSEPDPTDVVAMQSQYLAPSIHTPTDFSRHDLEFAQDPTHAFSVLEERNSVRERIYGDKTDESRLGHTPPALQDEFQSEQHEEWRRFMAGLPLPTPSTPSRTPTASTPESKHPSLSPATSSGSRRTNVTPVECPVGSNASARLSTPADYSSPLRPTGAPTHTRKRRREQEDEAPSAELHAAKLRRLFPTRSLLHLDAPSEPSHG